MDKQPEESIIITSYIIYKMTAVEFNVKIMSSKFDPDQHYYI